MKIENRLIRLEVPHDSEPVAVRTSQNVRYFFVPSHATDASIFLLVEVRASRTEYLRLFHPCFEVHDEYFFVAPHSHQMRLEGIIFHGQH